MLGCLNLVLFYVGSAHETWLIVPMASNNTASIAQARKLVEQLKMEANIDRIKVSMSTMIIYFKETSGAFVGLGFKTDLS